MRGHRALAQAAGQLGKLCGVDQERHAEEPLGGGNVSAGVVRVGDTVRRPAGPHTPAVHALLGYLQAVGFEGAPRPLGIDERGREILSFIEGTVPWPDRFGLLGPGDRLARASRLIRDFHDAVTGFVAPAGARWQVLIPAEGAEGKGDIIAHHDLAPWNLVIGPRWAFIDWDLAAPGTRLWDVAYAMHGFVPLSANPRWQRRDAPVRPPQQPPPASATAATGPALRATRAPRCPGYLLVRGLLQPAGCPCLGGRMHCGGLPAGRSTGCGPPTRTAW